MAVHESLTSAKTAFYEAILIQIQLQTNLNRLYNSGRSDFSRPHDGENPLNGQLPSQTCTRLKDARPPTISLKMLSIALTETRD